MNVKASLAAVLLISLLTLSFEYAGGLIFHSTALTADALHIITDILAVSFSFIALAISARPPAGRLTFGYHRVEVLASLVNGLSLVGVTAVIAYQAYLRFLNPHPIFVPGTVLFASIALALNVASSRILGRTQSCLGKEDQDLNVLSARVHLVGDALASLAVIAGAVLVYFTHNYIFDPIVAAFIGILVLRSAVSITMKGGAIILERSPVKNLGELRTKLMEVNGITDVHDLHVWRICSHITVASTHVCVDNNMRRNETEVRKELEEKLAEFGVQHMTIQLEDIACVPIHGHRI